MKSRRIYLGKGLTRAAAWRKCIANAKRLPDFRGMSYSAKTGWATVI